VAIITANLASLSEVSKKSPDSIDSAPQKSQETAGFISRAQQQGWIVDKPPEFTDEGRLMAAILLTRLIDHSRLCIANI
jgi:hypothetical protein